MTVINRKQRRRGWVMVGVLMVVFVITLMASAFYLQASDAASMNSIGSAAAIAATNADLGFKNGVLQLRRGTLNVVGLQTLGPCTEANVAAGTCANMVTSALVDNGADAGLGAGGGLQYQFFVYRRARFDGTEDPGQPRNRYTIRSVGFNGYSLNSANLVTSVVEAEIEIGAQATFECVGGYECQ